MSVVSAIDPFLVMRGNGGVEISLFSKIVAMCNVWFSIWMFLEMSRYNLAFQQDMSVVEAIDTIF